MCILLLENVLLFYNYKILLKNKSMFKLIKNIGFCLLLIYSSIVSAQCLKGDCNAGFGHKNTMLGKYEGNFSGGVMSGKGKLLLNDGSIYIGFFSKDQINGKGVMKYTNGDKYEGLWSNGLRSGKGILYFADKKRYNGSWVNDNPSGFGKLFSANGTILKEGNNLDIYNYGVEADGKKSIAEMAAELEKSVVFIEETSLNENKQISKAVGTGFIIGQRYIATNYHVVKENISIIQVRMRDDIIYRNVERVYVDDKLDLAILKIKDNLPFDYKALQFAETSPEKGEEVFTIGNSLGFLEFSMSNGIVAAQRTIAGNKALQITVPLSHGNSGGPLFNNKGRVVGITTAGIEEGQNLNIAYDLVVRKSFLQKFR